MNFTVIDFETTHPKRWSICQIGLVRVESGVVTAELDLLVQPPNNEVWSRFTEIHGIHWQDTTTQPTFDQRWPQILPYIDEQVVVAHNIYFDGSYLAQALAYYGIAGVGMAMWITTPQTPDEPTPNAPEPATPFEIPAALSPESGRLKSRTYGLGELQAIGATQSA
jgi:DNA polymerase III epsilon subunit-like protein